MCVPDASVAWKHISIVITAANKYMHCMVIERPLQKMVTEMADLDGLCDAGLVTKTKQSPSVFYTLKSPKGEDLLGIPRVSDGND
jgi:hypothetical protein